jgi:signal recognition particle subunit SRP54
MDGDTRGGAALSIKSVVDKPIKFIGTGEKVDALDVFHPNRMAERILGMGDVVSLVEKAQEQVDIEEAKRIQKKIAKKQFGYDDFLSQLKQVQQMGSMKDLVGMIPGASKALNGAEVDEDAFKGVEALIQSMTPKERQQPKLLNHSRKKRIANGAGMTIEDVNKLVKQFEQLSKMMKMMQGGKASHLMKMFGK